MRDRSLLLVVDLCVLMLISSGSQPIQQVTRPSISNLKMMRVLFVLMLISSGRPPRIALSRPTHSVLAYAGAVGKYSTVSQ